MLLQLHFYLLSAKGKGWEILKRLLCVCACVRLSYFYIILYISFVKISSATLQTMFMAVKTVSLPFKNNMAAIADCAKILYAF